MPAPESNGSFLGRISIRRNQVVSMDGNNEQELEVLELFQKHVAERFSDLLPPPPTPSDSSSATAGSGETLLSIGWLRKLLDVFLCCEAEFKAVLLMGRDPSHVAKPPLDRLIPDLLDRAVKALDVCNAVTHGVESVKNWQRSAEIVVAALECRPIGDAQVRRAKKALLSLLSSVTTDDKEAKESKEANPSSGKSTERSWSFGRRGGSSGSGSSVGRSDGSLRAISWSVPRNWSAAKQIQAMSTNLAPPRGGAAADASGLAQPVYVMSTVMVFVMWALVAAIPTQERSGLSSHIPVPRNLSWAHSMMGIQERIAEEWKKKEKKGCAGLMEESQRVEKLCGSLIEFTDSFQFPAEEERLQEIAAQVAELAEICRRMEEGLGPLQQQIREVFHRLVRSRSEVHDALDQAHKLSSAPSM